MSKTKTPYNKDTAFKAVVVLVLIGVVLGGLLALLNDLLYVSPEEITMRIIKKFYDGEEKAYTVVDVSVEDAANEYGTIDTVYMIEDGNYLIKTTGNQGFHEGTVSMWLLTKFSEGKFVEFIKVKYAESSGQTLMSNFNDDFYDVYVGSDIKNGYFSVVKGNTNVNVVAGTTKSSNAINNAVNSAYYYIVNVLEVQG